MAARQDPMDEGGHLPLERGRALDQGGESSTAQRAEGGRDAGDYRALPRVDLAAMRRSVKRRKERDVGEERRGVEEKSVPEEKEKDAPAVDTTRIQLVSPPPEEVLRRSGQRYNPTQQGEALFTPSLLARRGGAEGGGSAKRKRGLQMAVTPKPAPVASGSVGNGVDGIRRAGIDANATGNGAARVRASSPSRPGHARGWSGDVSQWEATPNPKPRKQVRRSQVAGEGVGGDVEMESPTKGRARNQPQVKVKGRKKKSRGRDEMEVDEDDDEDEVVEEEGEEMEVEQPPATPSRKTRTGALVQSPHVRNMDADYIPPVKIVFGQDEDKENAGERQREGPEGEGEGRDALGDLGLVGTKVNKRLFGARSGRRSVTPIPPYEPPKDVFSPPREVFVEPAKATPRRSRGRVTPRSAKGGAGVVVKLEMPDIDLRAPMPPPSPTDDPLLLSSDVEFVGWGVRGRSLEGQEELREEREEEGGDKQAYQQERQETPVRRKEKRGGETTGEERTSRTRTPGTVTRHGRTVEIGSTSTAEAAEVVVREERARGVVWPSDLPPSSPPQHDEDDEQGEGYFDWTKTGTVPMLSTDEGEEDSVVRLDSEDALVEPVRLFEFGSGAGDGWSDSDEEVEGARKAGGGGDKADGVDEGEGEYTGRWRMMRVRTKMDPPSSATRSRIELWGRPVSPFPGVVRKLDWGVGKGVEEEQLPVAEERLEDEGMIVEEPQQEADVSVEEEEEEVERMSMEPEPEEEQPLEEAAEEEEVRRMSMEPEDVADDEEQAQSEGVAVSEPATPFAFPRPPSLYEETFYDTTVPLPREEETDAEAGETEREDESQVADRGAGEEVRQRIPALPEHSLQLVSAVAGGEDDEDISDFEDTGVVKIVSADPRAAARAAAILKQHDYECFTKIMVKQRQAEFKRRHSSVGEMAQESRRRSLLGAGVDKKRDRASLGGRRRSTMGMGVVGDRVIIPGSPAITLPELLEEAERQVSLESPARRRNSTSAPASASTPARLSWGVSRNPFVTPGPSRSFAPVTPVVEGPREWTKEEWKLLDGCFTDERLDLVEQDSAAYAGVEMAPVNDVAIERVAARFVELVGGARTVETFGEAWSREALLQRVRALQKKQRAGNVAPPLTPSSRKPQVEDEPVGGRNRTPSMEVPDFTPLGRRAVPPRKPRASLPKPVLSKDTPFSRLPVDVPMTTGGRSRVPASLLAPRYSHLMDEAITVGHEVSSLAERMAASPSSQELGEESMSSTFHEGETLPDISMVAPIRGRPSIGKRLKGMLFSYLPMLSKTVKESKKTLRPPAHPGLPLPPIEVLEKPRGPIATPVRPPQPKAPHPKELVELHPAPAKLSMIPRPQKAPKRLVDLHPVTPVPEPVAPAFRPRRSSGGSVKDLIKSFEELENKEQSMTRPHSSLGRTVKVAKGVKPVWR